MLLRPLKLLKTRAFTVRCSTLGLTPLAWADPANLPGSLLDKYLPRQYYRRQ
jgi:hypothetical protein